MTLNYSISGIGDYTPSPLDSKVRVVLFPDKSGGIYKVKSLFTASTVLGPDDLVINGVPRGNRIFYGIESYFIPEGTGKQVEGTAHYALVTVSAWGDAMLIKLLEQ